MDTAEVMRWLPDIVIWAIIFVAMVRRHPKG